MNSARTFLFAIFALGILLVQESSFAQSKGLPSEEHPLVPAAIKKIDQKIASGPFEPNWDSLSGYEIPQWYKDAKFGLFIHWGVYSVPAFGSEWYPRQMYIDLERRGDNFFDHHASTYGSQKEFGYKDFIPKFKAEKFDPEAWTDLFEKAGVRYVVPVAEHHDGFPMYDCSFTEWDAVEMGPQRDIIGELAQSVRRRGIKFGVSSHRAFNWKYYVRSKDFDNSNTAYARLYGRPMPFLFEKDAHDYKKRFEPQDKQFKDDWLARTCELVDKYDPDLVWFDFGITASQETSFEDNHYSPYLQRFAAYYYNMKANEQGPTGVINYKWKAFPEQAAVLDLERSKMDAIRRPFWQTDTAISSSSWGYTEDQKYKDADRLVDDLVDIVAKNGCLLLNVGPRSDGTIPEKDVEVLLAIGSWLRVNGEAIYDSEPWKIFGEGPTGTATGHLSEKKNQPFTERDIRFTKKGDSLYAIPLAWPKNGKVVIQTLKQGAKEFSREIESVKLLGGSSKLDWKRDRDGLHVILPKVAQTKFAYVLKIN